MTTRSRKNVPLNSRGARGPNRLESDRRTGPIPNGDRPPDVHTHVQIQLWRPIVPLPPNPTRTRAPLRGRDRTSSFHRSSTRSVIRRFDLLRRLYGWPDLYAPVLATVVFTSILIPIENATVTVIAVCACAVRKYPHGDINSMSSVQVST